MADRKIMPQIRNLAMGNMSSWVVLIVDDQPDNLIIAEKILTAGGATVYQASNGEECLKQLESIEPSFVLLDLSMPVMNGWETFQRIKTNPKTEDIPVIALTAQGMSEDRERVLAAGFDGYIAKPFRLSTFMSEILRCFREIIHTK
jgi:two-component system, cell cycle response regulator DivK